MKIKKSRLIEIIREEIEEAKFRQSIRGMIREFTTTGTAAGAKKSGYQSKTRKAAQTDYDTKSADYDTKSAAVDASKRYRRPVGGKGGGYTYSSTGGFGWGTNPDYTSQVSARDTAETAKDSAKSTLDTETEADLQAEVPTQEPPSGGGAGGFGKGKAAGKGKGKDKKKKN